MKFIFLWGKKNKYLVCQVIDKDVFFVFRGFVTGLYFFKIEGDIVDLLVFGFGNIFRVFFLFVDSLVLSYFYFFMGLSDIIVLREVVDVQFSFQNQGCRKQRFRVQGFFLFRFLFLVDGGKKFFQVFICLLQQFVKGVGDLRRRLENIRFRFWLLFVGLEGRSI